MYSKYITYFPQYFSIYLAAKSLQLCPTLCDPIDGSPPGSPVPGILQARTLEWVAISSSNAWKWKVKVKSLVRGWLLATPWTAAYQAPPSMGFSRQEYWSGVSLPSTSAYILTRVYYLFTTHFLLGKCHFSLFLAKDTIFLLTNLSVNLVNLLNSQFLHITQLLKNLQHFPTLYNAFTYSINLSQAKWSQSNSHAG